MYQEIKSNLQKGTIEYTAEIGGKEPYFLLGHDDNCRLLKCRESGDLVINTYDKPGSYIRISSKSIFEFAKSMESTFAERKTDENGITTTKFSFCIHIAEGDCRNEWIGMTFGSIPKLHVNFEDKQFGEYKEIDVNTLIEEMLHRHYTEENATQTQML